MKKDESTLDIDFDFGEEKTEEVTISEETFLSDVLGPKGHLMNTHNAHGALRILHFKCIADKDYKKGSKFLLCRIPQSQVRVLGSISFIYGTVKKFCVGWSEFRNRYREVKDGMTDGILHNEKAQILDKIPLKSTVFDSLEGVEVYATAKSDGKKGDFIEGNFIYVKK